MCRERTTFPTRTVILSLLLGLSPVGCAPAVHPVTSLSREDGGRAVLGEPLVVSGHWWAMCATHHFDKNGPKQEVCHQQQVRFEAWCQGECRVEGDRVVVREKGASVMVVPLALGRIHVHAKNTRLSTGEVDTRTFSVDVVPPERLALRCQHDDNLSFAPCGPEGVSAAAPVIRPEIFLDSLQRGSRLLRVNSVVTPFDPSTPPLSLAQLFPEARQGEGVTAGTYPIELSLAGVTARFRVLAR